jgi:hypothetical protein
VMTLKDAIGEEIAAGASDPHEVARIVAEKYGLTWLSRQLMKISGDLVADLARAQIAASRRSSITLASVVAGAEPRVVTRELILESAWLPGTGWVKFGDFTAENFEELAETYRRGARSLNYYAAWCEEQAAAMRAQGVERFHELESRTDAA